MGMSRLPVRIAFFTSPMGPGDADLARAGLGAVEDRAAAPHPFAVVQDLQPLVGRVVAVEDEAVGVHEGGLTRTSAELLGEPDENSLGSPDVAQPIRVLVLDHFAHELGAAFA